MARDKEKEPGRENPNKDKENNCLGCGKKLANTHCHQCIICGLWIHKNCSGISDEFFKHLEDQVRNTGTAYWACRPCSTYSQGITKKMRAVETRVDQISDSVEAVKDTLKTVREDIDTVVNKVKKLEVEKPESDNNSVFQELRERDARKNNVVIHGMPECDSQGATGKEKQAWDLSKCTQLCQELGTKLDPDAFKFCRRVGAATHGPRPMVVGFFTEMERSLLLRKAKAIPNTSFPEVTVAPDLTKRQRKEETDLWAEKDEKNATRTAEQISKNLEWAVVGSRGERRLLLQPSRPPFPHRGAARRGRGGNYQPVNRGRGHQTGLRGGRPVSVTVSSPEEESLSENEIQPTQGRKRNAATADLGDQPPEKR